MVQEIEDAIMKNNITLHVMPSDKFNEYRMSIVGTVYDNHLRVGYISLNKMIIPLKNSFSKAGMNINKFYIIDAITKSAIPEPPKLENVIFIPSPRDFTKLSISLTKALQNEAPDIIVFDSLSTLIVYEDTKIILQLVRSIINKVNAFGVKCVFLILNGQKEQELINPISQMIDKTILLE